MSTIHNINGDLAAATAVLQSGDYVPVYVAADGVSKKMSGTLLGAGAGGVVVTTATAVSLSATVHGNKLLVVKTNSSSGCAITLPAATGTGVRYDIVNGIAQTQGSITVVRAGSDVIAGRQISLDSTAVATHQNVFVTLTATTMTWNRTTTGAATSHDHATLWDAESGTWRLLSEAVTSGDDVTPFS
jgi:hypothetical protein